MKIFSWGANSHGQLGQNTVTEACCVPTEISIACLDPASITSIVGGGGHTLILDRMGKVYSCGWNNKGQLGVDKTEATTFQPITALLGQNITQIACGWDSSLAVTLDGLLVWGSNGYSQLGLPKQKFSWLRFPKRVPISRVKQASLGLRHLAVVTEDGNIFVSGTGSKGQLGIVDSNRCPFTELQTLTQVPGLDNIISVSCGQHHSIALSKDGKIFVWGDNKFGQLGLDSTVEPVVLTPQELSLSSSGIKGHPSSVLAGWTHSVALTDIGEVVNWGRNTYGQLGRSLPWSPSILSLPETIKQVVVGSEHSVVMTENALILSWGWNEHGNCGTGTQENILEPSLVQTEGRGKATIVGTGACHSFVILDDN